MKIRPMSAIADDALTAGTLIGRLINDKPVAAGGVEYVDPFEDDTPVVCDTSEPETCEACD